MSASGRRSGISASEIASPWISPASLFAHVAGDQFDGLAGADQQHLLLRQVLEDLLRQAHGGIRHRHGAGADRGVGAHLLGDREGLLEQAVQDLAGDTDLVRGGERALHLPEDLRLAEHQRVEPGGHAERVLHGLLVGVQVEVRLDVVGRQAVEVAEPADRLAAVALVEAAIHLGAVAGREDRGLVHAAARGEVMQCFGQALGRERRLLADRDRGGLVIDAEGEEVHALDSLSQAAWTSIGPQRLL
jgi:hypothetical protein